MCCLSVAHQDCLIVTSRTLISFGNSGMQIERGAGVQCCGPGNPLGIHVEAVSMQKLIMNNKQPRSSCEILLSP